MMSGNKIDRLGYLFGALNVYARPGAIAAILHLR